MTKNFLDPVFSAVLKKHKLSAFDSLWKQEGQFVEEGNFKRKSGRSHVVRLKLDDSAKIWTVYMKRQENYLTTKSRILARPRAICEREFFNIKAWRKLGIPTPQALYFERQNQAGKQPLRAILITKGLEGYQPLDEWLEKTPNRKLRNQALRKTAHILRKIHQNGWTHNCFFPKHVFIRDNDGELDLRTIDLEKAKKCLVTQRRIANELTAFIRRCPWRSQAETLQFLKYYWNTKNLTMAHKRVIKRIHARMQMKAERERRRG